MALPASIDLHIVTPDRELVREQVDEIEIPGSEGISASCPGTRRCSRSWRSANCGTRKGAVKTYLAIAFGFTEVLPDRVTVLALIGGARGRQSIPSAPRRRRSAPRRGCSS